MHLDVAAAVPLLLLLLSAVAAAEGGRQLRPSNEVFDVQYPGALVQSNMCGSCDDGVHVCGVATPDFLLPTGSGNALIVQGTSLQCQSGHCVPKTRAELYADGVRTFCAIINVAAAVTTGSNITSFSAASPSPAPMLNFTFFNDITAQTEVCSPCCDGKHSCGSGLLCYASTDADSTHGYCAPSTLPASRFEEFCKPTALTSRVFACDASTQLPASTTTAQQQQKPVTQGSSPQPVNYNSWLNMLAAAAVAQGPAAGPAPGPLSGMAFSDVEESDTSNQPAPNLEAKTSYNL